MQKSFKSRLEELERLEAEAEQEAERLAGPSAEVAALADDDLLALVFDGLRARHLSYLAFTFYGDDAYWRAIADRANDEILDQGKWVCPVSAAEACLVASALRDGRMRVIGYASSHGSNPPGPDYGYCFLPPEPYPAGCWETPEYAAAKMAACALFGWVDLWRNVPEAPPMPGTVSEVMDWLEQWYAEKL